MTSADGAGPLRFWRSAGDLLFCHGVQDSYFAEPHGEYFLCLVQGHGLLASRGRQRFDVRPGDLVVWDPSEAHGGRPVEQGGAAWECRMLVLDRARFADLAGDPRLDSGDLEFPDPLRGTRLTAVFLGLHLAAARQATALELDTRLIEVSHALALFAPGTPRMVEPPAPAWRDAALRRAREYLRDNLARNVTLDELVEVAGIPKYRLIRAFRSGVGMPPHRYQIGLRLRASRRLLERGLAPAEVAGLAGFYDQSHLHRHFRRNLGMTPAQYARAADVCNGVQDNP
ncbi:MAG: helix-turn-helix domain-containing protein [Sciscionella sp.]